MIDIATRYLPRPSLAILQVKNALVIRKDVYNYRAKLKRKKAAGYTAVGALIKKFDEEGIPYKALWKPNDKDQLQALVFYLPEMVDHMKAFPYVWFLDFTYKTNHLKLPFFQSNTITSITTNLSLFFGVMTNEREDTFLFVFDSIKQLLQQLKVPKPRVIIADKYDEAKNALSAVFPDIQQQICTFHILKNVLINAKKKWKKKKAGNATANEENED